MKKTNQELIGIDIFAGAGGLSLGAELAGIFMRYAVECDPHVAESYRRNFKKATVFCEDIRKASLPSAAQCKRLLKIVEKAEDKGYIMP